MCLISYEPIKGLDRQDYLSSLITNDSGFGWIEWGGKKPRFGRIAPKNGTDFTGKEMENILQLIETLKFPRVLHFRLATHGGVSKANTHPFRVGGHGLLMHNGIFGGYGGKWKSDTADFIERRILPRLPHVAPEDFLANQTWDFNKVAYFNWREREIHLFGEFLTLDKEIMVSNCYSLLDNANARLENGVLTLPPKSVYRFTLNEADNAKEIETEFQVEDKTYDTTYEIDVDGEPHYAFGNDDLLYKLRRILAETNKAPLKFHRITIEY
jgi:hypothetical protein